MLVGVPKEIKDSEYRVGLVPSAVRELIRSGHHVLVETNALVLERERIVLPLPLPQNPEIFLLHGPIRVYPRLSAEECRAP